ncbi:FecR family protein [Spirosoma radiotolerans]|uniref:Iron dicitrate transport regulator FecR n=1 Tax=Spirosoma radiotolerans TaxID=1379870 RepID=A0A0E3VAK2_9BACT|nr:FecR domain-containing protein [Spirosoma radiotolerans]AKD58221.1 hypothetical protein SD10_28320 [Spirosoma radiotolerans]
MSDSTPWALLAKYLSGECSQDERLQVEQWLEIPENFTLFQSIEAAWRKVTPLREAERFSLEEGQNRLLAKLEESRVTHAKPNEFTLKPIYKWVMAASVSALLLVSVFWKNQSGLSVNRESYRPIQQISQAGQRKQVRLPDGSLVWLNENSSLVFPETFAVDQRTVTLTGEGFFEVVPNKKKPFIVQSAGLATRVLGTSFNVKTYADKSVATVSVATGKVEVSKAKGSSWEKIAQLIPQQRVVVNRENNQTYIDTVSLSSIAAWRMNSLNFRNSTMGNIIQTLESHYNITIELENEALKQCKIMASFEPRASLKEVLSLLSLSASFQYKIEGSLVKIYGGACQ